ncbi:MAG TPA: aldehyde dehydrogenase family protein, partial [Puia sp.]|nr:aldehyde dehydrogenase family protein [Puia sp.]
MDFLDELQIKPGIIPGTSTGTQWLSSHGTGLESLSPVDGKRIGVVTQTDKAAYDQVVSAAQEAFKLWRAWPA